MTPAAPATAGQPDAAPRGADHVVLVGNPNVGKSVIFGLLTGRYVTVSNYPGTTVEVSRGSMVLEGTRFTVIDTPGVNTLVPMSEDERVARDILLAERHHTLVQVGDTKNLSRALLLTLQIAEMGLPFVLCLNMRDEASRRGIRVDCRRLSEILGVEVVPTVAVRREGLAQLTAALGRPRACSWLIRYDPAIEDCTQAIEALLPEGPIGRRSLALMILSGDDSLSDWLRAHVPEATLDAIESLRRDLQRGYRIPLQALINQQRQREAERVAALVRQGGAPVHRPIGRLLDVLTLHPLLGLPVLAIVLYLMYLFVGVLGAGIAVDLLENTVFGRYINPWVVRTAAAVLPWAWLRDLFAGPYGLVTMACTYAIALILPIVTTFFLAFGVLEDSGYLPRLAILMNRGFKVIGLNGKAVLPMVLGLGCDTMATLTTRILETRKERTIAIVLLALGVPCSAQLTVTLALLAGLSWKATAIWLSVVLGTIVTVGYLSSLLVPGRGSDFILEIPPLRVPTLSNILTKTLARVEWYLKEAVPLFLLGTLILYIADACGALAVVERAVAPVVRGVLGLPEQTAGVFILGFLRRDFGAAGLFHMVDAGQLDAVNV
ncbi:MAG TPA: ferrous iron transport protein B, partial [Candidatus Polarisedimenticolia bacterium]|nr:ferrous iron transport protein B [Candidatus Polarisedimenticolia bacterium]